MQRVTKEMCLPSENHSHFYRQFERVQIGFIIFTHLSGLLLANWGAQANFQLRRFCSITKLTDELSYSALPRIQLSNVTHSHLCGEHATLSEFYLQFSQLLAPSFYLGGRNIDRLYVITNFRMSARTYFLRQ